MKGKRKATANPVLSEAMERNSNIVEVQVQELNDGEEKEMGRDGDWENQEEEEEEEGEEAEEGEEGEGEGEGEGEEGKGEDAQEEKPKLDEGFFEIEAIRRKRVRKGELQYLIKWRGWPETANTWEPLENLQSCSDVIDAFEESLRSGKSSRKRRRKSGPPHTQPKKRHQRSSAAYNLTYVEKSALDKSLFTAPLSTTNLGDLPTSTQYTAPGHEVEIDGDINNSRTSMQPDDNGSLNGSKHILERKEDNEYDPKLSELRVTMSTNGANSDKLALHFRDLKVLEGDHPTNGLSKVEYIEPVQNNRRTGAKRRKSGAVKRFQKDAALSEPASLPNSSPNISGFNGSNAAQPGVQNLGLAGSNLFHKPMSEDSMNASAVTKIIKPISFSASVLDDVQDVLVTFVAMRSDGKEVIVNNRSLKAHNPLLLINFYEQHLRYST